MQRNICFVLVVSIFLFSKAKGLFVNKINALPSNNNNDLKNKEYNKVTNKPNINYNVILKINDLDNITDESDIEIMLDVTNKVKHKEALNNVKIYANTAKELRHRIHKRAMNRSDNDRNNTIITENMTEPCVGMEEYCNMTKEEYVAMLQDYIYPQTYEWVLIATHTIVFVFGLVGNALVCIAVYRNHSMRTVTNYFIVNLAAADFMVILFCMPPTVLWDVTETWFLGNALCKLLLYFQSVSVTVSVLTLTFISVDRWYAICFPLKFKSTTGRAKTAILIIWAISLTFNSPELVVLQTVQMVPLRFELNYLVQCSATWSPTSEIVWHILKILLIYTIPLLLMTVAYHQIVKVLWKNQKIPGQAETVKLASAEQSQLRSRRKAAKMLVAVVVMFAVCFFPIHLLCILRYTMDMEQNDAVTLLALISHVLCYANSAINPLIYNFMSGKFRRAFRRTFCCSIKSDNEIFTSLTRMTTSKAQRPCAHVTWNNNRRSPQVDMSTTTFIENGFKKGYLT